jgi:Cu2+-exporting ATPase
LIHSSGLDSFYQMVTSDKDGRGRPVAKSQTEFVEFDQDVFQQRYARPISEFESSIELSLEGIHCGACVWLIEKLPLITPGVVSATANWAKRTVVVRWRRSQVSLSKIASSLNRIGYRPSPIQPNTKRDRWILENRSHLTRIGVAAACAGNNMIISAALYFGMFSHMTIGMSGLLRVASCVVGIVALCWPGRVFLKSALTALKTRTPHMDLPIALALTVGTLAGLANVIRGVGEIYFDSLSVLIFLLLIGRWIQFRQQSKATDAVEMLYRLTPQMTRRIVDGKAEDVLVDLVEVDNLLEILPGDLFPVDGKIVEGETSVDESILTGESELQSRGVGGDVSAGTRNNRSSVVIRACAVGRDTRLSHIVGLVENASLQKPQIVQWANKIGGYFVAAVIAMSAITFLYWFTLDVQIAIDRTIALLIVACPCALALATPLAIAVAIGRAAKNRIMIKGGDVLQSLQRPGRIWLDKTGTLTKGELQVVRWHGDHSWIDYVAAIESKSNHPVAVAIQSYANAVWTPRKYFQQDFGDDAQVEFVRSRTNVESIESHDGLGVGGVVGETEILVGNERLLLTNSVQISSYQSRVAANEIAAGRSPCWVAVNGKVVALVALGDAIRADSKSAIDRLKARGWKVGILSGDHQKIVDRVANQLGIELSDAKGGFDPESKLKIVNSSSKDGTVIMVGDGVNDSAALAAANVGIAVKGGAEASLAAAPVYFANPGLNPVLGLLEIADSSSSTMRLNLAVSLIYNTTFAMLAFAGFINPLVAAILMPISSITVVALSLGSGKVRKKSTNGTVVAKLSKA